MNARHVNADGTPRYTNQLINETSPYLRQHAHNPVDWFPWGAAALEKARREGKPIHLSVGYSACWWCHVLESESFEDEATARVLNDNFVNIKVDREERPDIDRIYQIAQQLLTQRSGGWPLTMFLTHDDQRPFFGGTYFPKEPRYGLPGFKDLLLRVSSFYRERQGELRQQNDALMRAFEQLGAAGTGSEATLDAAPLAAAREQLARTFDPRHGGFGGAPKFPQPQILNRLLRDWRATANQTEPDLKALYMVTFTLRHMADGGLYDQLGGGFCRYTVDEAWMIPHFEKMLYDNAGLLALYAQAAIATGDPQYSRIAAETAQFVLREMRSPQGGFYSSFDARSGGHEGRFYLWDPEEVRNALTAEEFAAFAPYYGLDRPANFEGHWQLFVATTPEALAGELNIAPADLAGRLASARAKLLRIRALREPPPRDDKVLTSWNALMIRALAIAARALERPDLAAAATQALAFIRAQLWREGRLLVSYMDGKAHLNAYLDDYVYLADAILELQQVRFDAAELAFARELLEIVLRHFADKGGGGFYFTSDDHEQLILRSRSFGDDAIPSGNGIGAYVLQRFGQLLAEPRYLQAAEATLRAAWAELGRHAPAHASLLTALEELLHPPLIVIIRGAGAAVAEWQRELARLYTPRALILGIAADAQGLPAALSDKRPGKTTLAYVCRGSVCSAPLDSVAGVLDALRAAETE